MDSGLSPTKRSFSTRSIERNGKDTLEWIIDIIRISCLVKKEKMALESFLFLWPVSRKKSQEPTIDQLLAELTTSDYVDPIALVDIRAWLTYWLKNISNEAFHQESIALISKHVTEPQVREKLFTMLAKAARRNFDGWESITYLYGISAVVAQHEHKKNVDTTLYDLDVVNDIDTVRLMLKEWLGSSDVVAFQQCARFLWDLSKLYTEDSPGINEWVFDRIMGYQRIEWEKYSDGFESELIMPVYSIEKYGEYYLQAKANQYLIDSESKQRLSNKDWGAISTERLQSSLENKEFWAKENVVRVVRHSINEFVENKFVSSALGKQVLNNLDNNIAWFYSDDVVLDRIKIAFDALSEQDCIDLMKHCDHSILESNVWENHLLSQLQRAMNESIRERIDLNKYIAFFVLYFTRWKKNNNRKNWVWLKYAYAIKNGSIKNIWDYKNIVDWAVEYHQTDLLQLAIYWITDFDSKDETLAKEKAELLQYISAATASKEFEIDRLLLHETTLCNYALCDLDEHLDQLIRLFREDFSIDVQEYRLYEVKLPACVLTYGSLVKNLQQVSSRERAAHPNRKAIVYQLYMEIALYYAHKNKARECFQAMERWKRVWRFDSVIERSKETWEIVEELEKFRANYYIAEWFNLHHLWKAFVDYNNLQETERNAPSSEAFTTACFRIGKRYLDNSQTSKAKDFISRATYAPDSTIAEEAKELYNNYYNTTQ